MADAQKVCFRFSRRLIIIDNNSAYSDAADSPWAAAAAASVTFMSARVLSVMNDECVRERRDEMRCRMLTTWLPPLRVVFTLRRDQTAEITHCECDYLYSPEKSGSNK